MLPLKFCKMCFRRHIDSPLPFIGRQRLPYIRLGNPELSGNPRRRDARLEGGTNGIQLTTIHGTSAVSACGRFSVGGERFVAKSDGRGDDRVKSAPILGGSLPRCFTSSNATAKSSSNSPSLKCLTALGKSFGKICRRGAVSVVASAAGNFFGGGASSRTALVEKRSASVDGRSRSHSITCRHQRWTAIRGLKKEKQIRSPSFPILRAAQPCRHSQA